MILNITVAQFPDETLKDIKYSQNIYRSIDFNFGKDANIAINKASLEKFVNKFKKIHSTHDKPIEGIVTLGSMKHLSSKTIKLLLSSEDFINMLDPQSFLKLIVTSDEIADFALNNPKLKAKLDNIEPLIDKQKFKNSCTARAIMRILLERGYIDQSNYTPSKELEIYREIWLEPGKVASPEKIVSYFQKHQLNVIGIEIKELSKSALNKYSRDTVITSLYSLFRKDVPIRKKLTLTTLSETDFPQGTTTLIVINTGVLHTLLGKKCDGQFEVIDPQFGDKKIYNGFMDFLEKERKTMGVFFEILPRTEETFRP
ncbi:dehydrogenase [Legionella lansingensis]|uniref:Dehydrogenase n=1 Tax=Legionella lansingensis TaxID=45067 RepID=A0A0W0VF38_9GAMM|nr:dehydrogenase [Legionella lansingensis]SNV58223.1 dehydrogenase [Legionella lansingensis]